MNPNDGLVLSQHQAEGANAGPRQEPAECEQNFVGGHMQFFRRRGAEGLIILQTAVYVFCSAQV